MNPVGNGVPAPQRVRCALYTRKSTEEGLDQEFNSLESMPPGEVQVVANYTAFLGLRRRLSEGRNS